MALLDEDGNGNLSIAEFKAFLLNEECKNKFRKIMRNVRDDIRSS